MTADRPEYGADLYSDDAIRDPHPLHALTRRVRRIEVGKPTPLLSNLLRGYRSFPASPRP